MRISNQEDKILDPEQYKREVARVLAETERLLNGPPKNHANGAGVIDISFNLNMLKGQLTNESLRHRNEKLKLKQESKATFNELQLGFKCLRKTLEASSH